MLDKPAQSIEAVIAELEASRTAAQIWIARRIKADGEAAGARVANSYYRLPWVLAVAGLRDEAARTLSWIARHALDESGDFVEGAPRAPLLKNGASYTLPQIVIGAWHLEQYDLALKIMNLLRDRFCDPATGAAYAERPEVRRTRRQELFGSAQLGLAALTVGDDVMARRIFRWIELLYAAQPDLPQKLYTLWEDKGLVTGADAETDPWNSVTDFHKPHQQFFNPGIAAAFLGRFYARTGEYPALELAHKFLQLTIDGDALQFDHKVNAQACKFGWGAAVLLDVSPTPEMLTQVLRMARWFIESQGQDGRWHPSGFLCPSPTDADDMPKTAEHLLHEITIISSLSKYHQQLQARPLAGNR